jgi:hypothetical protein
MAFLTIIKQVNIAAFQLKFLDSMKIHLVFHVSLLERYHASIVLRWVSKPPSPIEVNGEQKYEVEEIINSKPSNQGPNSLRSTKILSRCHLFCTPLHIPI